MATDNTQLSVNVGSGDIVRDLNDTSNVKWPAAIASYVTGGTTDAWTLAAVDITHGLPIQPMTGTTFAVTGTFWQATQPVSAASLPLPTGASTEATLSTLNGKVTACNTGAVVVSSSALPSGAATAANQTTEIASLSSIDGKITACNTGAVTISAALPAGTNAIGKLASNSGVTIGAVEIAAGQTTAVTNAGTFAVQAAQSGTWNITNVSGTVSLPTGAATSAAQTTGNASLSSIDGKVPALGQALAAASVPVVLTAAQVSTLTPLSSVSITGSVAVTGTFWQATQPVSGTVAFSNTTIAVTNVGTFATQAAQSGTWNITNISGTVSLPTGASTAAKQPALGTAGTASSDVITVQGIASMTALKVDGSAVTQPVSGTITANAGTGTFTISGAVTQSGTWNIGTVTTVTTCSTVTSLSQWAGNAIDTNSGNKSAGTLRVVLATDQPALTNNALTAGSAIIGKVGIDQTTPGTTNAVQDIAGTSGGASISSFISTAAVQATAVKASAGQVYSLEFFNINSTPVYVRLYNMTTTPGTGDTVVWRGIVPGNTAGAGFMKAWPQGLAFSTGIGMRCTGAIADNDATALAANTVLGNVVYK